MTGALLVAAALFAMAIAVVRVVRGPRHADRIVALDLLFAAGIAACVAAALASGRPEFLDVGAGLAVTGFVATIAWAGLIERGAGGNGPAAAPRERRP